MKRLNKFIISIIIGFLSINLSTWALKTQSTHEFSSIIYGQCNTPDLANTHLEAVEKICLGEIEQISFNLKVLNIRWGDMHCPIYQDLEVTSKYVCHSNF